MRGDEKATAAIHAHASTVLLLYSSHLWNLYVDEAFNSTYWED